MFVSGLCVVRCAAKWKGSRRCRNKGRVVEQPTHPHTRHITTNEHAPLTPCLTCHADYHLRSIPLGQTGTIRTQVRRHNTGIQVLGRRKKKKNEGNEEADPRRDYMASAATAQDKGLSGGSFRPRSLAFSQNGRSRPRQPLRRCRARSCIRNFRPHL